MKKFLLVLLVLVFFPLSSHAQITVVDPIAHALIEWSHFDQVVHYVQMIEHQVSSAKSLIDQVKNAEKQLEIAMQNMNGLNDIHSWDDFMDWYNRQLYYERMATEKFKNMNVTIGKENYSLYDLEGISKGIDQTYIKYWENEFTEEQRREMWLQLGLSPSNYAYVQPYRAKASEIYKQHLTMSEIQNDKNNKTSEENFNDREALAKDAIIKDPNKKMGDREIQQRQLAALDRVSETLVDISAMEAKQMEAMGIEKALENTPKSNPPKQKWEINGFAPIDQ